VPAIITRNTHTSQLRNGSCVCIYHF